MLSSSAGALGAVTGVVPSSPAVGAFAYSEISFWDEDLEGAGAAGAAGVTRVSFALGPGVLDQGDSIVASLPLFALSDSIAVELLNGSSAGLTLSWDATEEELTVVVDDAGAAGGGLETLLFVSGLDLPPIGVAANVGAVKLVINSYSTKPLTLRTQAANAPVAEIIVETIRPLGYLASPVLACDPSPCHDHSPRVRVCHQKEPFCATRRRARRVE